MRTTRSAQWKFHANFPLILLCTPSVCCAGFDDRDAAGALVGAASAACSAAGPCRLPVPLNCTYASLAWISRHPPVGTSNLFDLFDLLPPPAPFPCVHPCTTSISQLSARRLACPPVVSGPLHHGCSAPLFALLCSSVGTLHLCVK